MKMNKTMACIVALAVMAVSCSKHQDGQGARVSFSVDTDLQVTEVTRSNVSDYTALPEAGKFTIVVTDHNDDEIYNGLLEAYNQSTSLNAGNYTVKASYGSTSDEGFEKPCFEGSKTFSITGGETENVEIPVSLTNTIIRVACTERFKAYYTDYSFKVKTGSGTEIDFPKGEDRGAFIDAYSFTVTGSLTNQGGKAQTFTKNYTSLKPKACYTLKFDVSNLGTGAVTVTFDDTVEDADLTDFDLNN